MLVSASGISYISKKQVTPASHDWDPKAMFLMLIWPSLRNIAFAEIKKKGCTRVETPLIVAVLGVFQHCLIYNTSPCDHLSQWHVAPTHSWFTFFISEKLIPSNVKWFNIVNHAKFSIWNFKWTSLNWYIMLFPLAIWFKWFHA